ncbi:unnamed protein product [Paramecium sonneborni]|uniref:Uncharacterized protein n=1 Tax=Paramecium sonneborni TaxID=65129 RepID=A0A8S1PNX2_9CILI|nr:unnamed protein product [Paramecium sonneborni]
MADSPNVYNNFENERDQFSFQIDPDPLNIRKTAEEKIQQAKQLMIESRAKIEKIRDQLLNKRCFIKIKEVEDKQKFEKNLQKQVINILVTTLYKCTNNKYIKERIENVADQIIEEWITLIDTNIKFKKENPNLNNLDQLNQQYKLKSNKNIFRIKQFNQTLIKEKCQIQIQKSTQYIDLEQQINGIKYFFHELKKKKEKENKQNQFAFIDLQISALEELMEEVFRKKQLLSKKYMAINPNFNKKDFINFWNDDQFKQEFQNLQQLFENKNIEILKLFKVDQNSEKFDCLVSSISNLLQKHNGIFDIKKIKYFK